MNLTYSPFLPIVLGAATLVGSAQAGAADIPAALAVDRVTVYPEGAIVTRAGKMDIPAGSTALVIAGLPGGIEAKTLRVEIANAAVRLGGIDVQRINEGTFASDAERQLRHRLEQLTDQRGAIQDEVATAQLQLTLLDSLAAGQSGGPPKATVDGAHLGSVLATMAANSAAARKRMRDANLQARTVDREIDTLKADLAKIATQSKQSTSVRAALETKVAVTATVTVSYKITAASWHWIYAARLDTTKKRLALERQGQVQQGTGEDWRNVELTLATAPPLDDLATPRVAPLFIDLPMPLLKREAFAQRGVAFAPAPAPAMLAASSDALQELAPTAARAGARLDSTEYLADYTVPSRVTLLADRQPRLYPIADDTFDVDLIARVVPSVGRTAHLEAAFQYRRDVPLDGGQLQLYRDGAYVGEAATKAFLPGAEVRMPFGTDERIRVLVEEEAGRSTEHGVLARQSVRETKRRFDVTSYHPAPIAVEVIDRVPVSKHADVHVEILKGATEPSEKDVGGKAGVVVWRFSAAPQKTVSIRQYYSVESPKDRPISETEGMASE